LILHCAIGIARSAENLDQAAAIGDDEGGEVSAYLKRLTSRRAANEQVRLLYVAATRAKQTLELSAAPKAKADGTIAPRNGTLLACLWPAVASMLARGAAAGTPLLASRT